MAQRQAQTTPAPAQITFDHNDPAVFTAAWARQSHARMNPAHELSTPRASMQNMRLPDVVREVMKRHGRAVAGVSDAQVFTRAGSMVTGDLAGILGDSAGRGLRTAYDAAPSGLRPLRGHDVETSRCRPNTCWAMRALRRVLEGGEYPMGSVAGVKQHEHLNLRQHDPLRARCGSATIWARWLTQPPHMGIAAREFEHAACRGSDQQPDHGRRAGGVCRGAQQRGRGFCAERHQSERRACSDAEADFPANGMPVNAAPRFLIVPPEYETIQEQLLTTLNATAVTDVNPSPSCRFWWNPA